MAKVKVTVAYGVVNDVHAGGVVEVDERDLVWLSDLGYIDGSAKAQPKAAPKKVEDKPAEEKAPAKRPARRQALKKDEE